MYNAKIMINKIIINATTTPIMIWSCPSSAVSRASFLGGEEVDGGRAGVELKSKDVDEGVGFMDVVESIDVDIGSRVDVSSKEERRRVL